MPAWLSYRCRKTPFELLLMTLYFYISCKFAAGMSFSRLSRARSLSMSLYADEIHWNMYDNSKISVSALYSRRKTPWQQKCRKLAIYGTFYLALAFSWCLNLWNEVKHYTTKRLLGKKILLKGIIIPDGRFCYFW